MYAPGCIFELPESRLPSEAVSREVDLDDLVDASEIAKRLSVARPQVVHDWRRRHADFPKPVKRLANVHIWLWSEVEPWARRTGRL